MRTLAPIAVLAVACSPAEGPETAGTTGPPPPTIGAEDSIDYDGLFPWAFEIAHEMAADLDEDGDSDIIIGKGHDYGLSWWPLGQSRRLRKYI